MYAWLPWFLIHSIILAASPLVPSAVVGGASTNISRVLFKPFSCPTSRARPAASTRDDLIRIEGDPEDQIRMRVDGFLNLQDGLLCVGFWSPYNEHLAQDGRLHFAPDHSPIYVLIARAPDYAGWVRVTYRSDSRTLVLLFSGRFGGVEVESERIFGTQGRLAEELTGLPNSSRNHSEVLIEKRGEVGVGKTAECAPSSSHAIFHNFISIDVGPVDQDDQLQMFIRGFVITPPENRICVVITGAAGTRLVDPIAGSLIPEEPLIVAIESGPTYNGSVQFYTYESDYGVLNVAISMRGVFGGNGEVDQVAIFHNQDPQELEAPMPNLTNVTDVTSMTNMTNTTNQTDTLSRGDSGNCRRSAFEPYQRNRIIVNFRPIGPDDEVQLEMTGALITDPPLLCIDIHTPDGVPLTRAMDGDIQRRFRLNTDDYVILMGNVPNYFGEIRVQFHGGNSVSFVFRGQFGRGRDVVQRATFYGPYGALQGIEASQPERNITSISRRDDHQAALTKNRDACLPHPVRPGAEAEIIFIAFDAEELVQINLTGVITIDPAGFCVAARTLSGDLLETVQSDADLRQNPIALSIRRTPDYDGIIRFVYDPGMGVIVWMQGRFGGPSVLHRADFEPTRALRNTTDMLMVVKRGNTTELEKSTRCQNVDQYANTRQAVPILMSPGDDLDARISGVFIPDLALLCVIVQTRAGAELAQINSINFDSSNPFINVTIDQPAGHSGWISFSYQLNDGVAVTINGKFGGSSISRQGFFFGIPSSLGSGNSSTPQYVSLNSSSVVNPPGTNVTNTTEELGRKDLVECVLPAARVPHGQQVRLDFPAEDSIQMSMAGYMTTDPPLLCVVLSTTQGGQLSAITTNRFGLPASEPIELQIRGPPTISPSRYEGVVIFSMIHESDVAVRLQGRFGGPRVNAQHYFYSTESWDMFSSTSSFSNHTKSIEDVGEASPVLTSRDQGENVAGGWTNITTAPNGTAGTSTTTNVTSTGNFTKDFDCMPRIPISTPTLDPPGPTIALHFDPEPDLPIGIAGILLLNPPYLCVSVDDDHGNTIATAVAQGLTGEEPQHILDIDAGDAYQGTITFTMMAGLHVAVRIWGRFGEGAVTVDKLLAFGVDGRVLQELSPL